MRVRVRAVQPATLQALAQMLAQQWQQQRQVRQLSCHATRLQDLVRASGDWSWELDAALRHVWVSGDCEAVTGESTASLMGCPCGPEGVVDAEGRPLPDGLELSTVLARRQPVSRLLTLRQTPRGERYLSRSAVPITDAQGRFGGFRGTTRDMTRQMRSEQAARAQRQAFEALQQDKERAEHASRAKNSLLSRVSHELRTPLNAVLGFAQLMKVDAEQPLVPAQSARLDGIVMAGQRLLVVVDDLLELVSVERHRPGDTPEAVDLQQAAERVVQAWQARAVQAGRRIQLQPGPALRALASAALVDQILNRLLADALACGSAEAPVQVSVRTEGLQAVLEVGHTSWPGAALNLSQLFEPFDFTGLGEGAVPGSGLDLVIARDLARACGGDVSATLAGPQDLRILVGLPLWPQDAASAVTAPSAHGPRQVLYVEDEPLNVVLMQEIFRGRPEWLLHIACTGSEGVTLAQQLQPDLLLIDMNLPDFGGLEVLRRVRADPATRAIPAIALSADAMTEQVAAARAAGFQDYWTKPIDLNGLLRDLAAVLAKAG